MFSDYYKREIRHLRELGMDFAKEYPILAPMLTGPSADADVERLLEGVAFLTAGINRKLDDEFPEILHTLMQMICPDYLCPVPAATIIAFTPNENLSEPLHIPAGTYIDSVPISETACRFSTCSDVRVSPLTLVNAELIESTGGVNIDQLEIRLSFKLTGMALAKWNTDTLRLYLSGDYAQAADLYLMLSHYLREIVVRTPQERLFGRSVFRGQNIRIKIRNDHYASLGDMYLFGSVLDYFLGSYASINTYTALTFEDVIRGEQIQWPARLGTRPLL